MAKKTAGSKKKADEGNRSWELKLYVAGDNNVNSKIAITQIEKICVAYLYGNCHLEVVDLRKKPEIAIKERIVALPTLVRTSPGPKKVLVGNLSDEDKVLHSLEIKRLSRQ